MKTIFVKQKDTDRKWFVIDADGQREIGDYVIIVNAERVTVTGRKAQQKMYYKHSGYIGSLRSESFEKALKRKPQFPLEHAVRGMLPKNRLGRKLFTNLKVYAGPDHPHVAQQPQPIQIPAVKEA